MTFFSSVTSPESNSTNVADTVRSCAGPEQSGCWTVTIRRPGGPKTYFPLPLSGNLITSCGFVPAISWTVPKTSSSAS